MSTTEARSDLEIKIDAATADKIIDHETGVYNVLESFSLPSSTLTAKSAYTLWAETGEESFGAELINLRNALHNLTNISNGFSDNASVKSLTEIIRISSSFKKAAQHIKQNKTEILQTLDDLPENSFFKYVHNEKFKEDKGSFVLELAETFEKAADFIDGSEEFKAIKQVIKDLAASAQSDLDELTAAL